MFEPRTLTSMILTAALGWAGTAAGQTAPAAPEKEIGDFVRQVFIHGVPYEEASRYGPAVVPELIALLEDPAEAPHAGNIAIVLGILGDERAAEPLITFIEGAAGQHLTPRAYRARTSAILALGYLIHKSGSERALAFLVDGLDRQAWLRAAKWTSPFHDRAAERNEALREAAVLGLALSGHPAAAEALRAEGTALARSPSAAADRLRGHLEAALGEHAKIARQGLETYDRTLRLQIESSP